MGGAAGALPARRIVFSCRMTHGFCHRRAYAPYHSIGHHTGQAAAQAVPGNRRVQAHAGDDAIRFSRCAGNADDQEHPWQHRDPGGHIAHGRDQQLQEYDIEHHHGAHGAKHPAPALKNIGGVFAAAHGEGQRREDHQKCCHHIPLRDLKKQLYHLPHNDDAHNNN